jgi:hypothetical protein
VKHEFAKAGMSEVYRRLGELEEAGVLRSERVLTYNRKIYLLTKDAYDSTNPEARVLVPFLKRPRLYQIEHDIRVTEVRIALQRLYPGTLWIPERTLQAQASQGGGWLEGEPRPVGDGVLVSWKGERIAVEVECSLKGEKRLQGIIKGWIRHQEVAFVLYVVSNAAIQKAVRRVLQSLSAQDGSDSVGFVLIDELVQAKDLLAVQTIQGPITLELNPSKEEATHAN